MYLILTKKAEIYINDYGSKRNYKLHIKIIDNIPHMCGCNNKPSLSMEFMLQGDFRSYKVFKHIWHIYGITSILPSNGGFLCTNLNGNAIKLCIGYKFMETYQYGLNQKGSNIVAVLNGVEVVKNMERLLLKLFLDPLQTIQQIGTDMGGFFLFLKNSINKKVHDGNISFLLIMELRSILVPDVWDIVMALYIRLFD